jgi:alkylated DNA repair dioxygenase AlkB/ubiquinone/menaquinone biosynthesis C-methylase UbiE
MSMTTDDSGSRQAAAFRSVLPHEPLSNNEHAGYLHIHGSFEPKKAKKKEGEEEVRSAADFWTPMSLHEALSSSAAVQSLSELSDIEILDKAAPFIKVRFVFESPEAAFEAFKSWRRLKVTPQEVFSAIAITDQQQFATRQLQVTQITQQPMLPTHLAWTRSNPPKFRRLLNTDGPSLDEERSEARFVFITNLIEQNAAPECWSDSYNVLEAIRKVVNDYDSTGLGVEVFVPHKTAAYHCHVGMRVPADAQRLIRELQGKTVQWSVAQNVVVQSPKLFLDYADITMKSVSRSHRTEGLEVERGEPSRSECTSTTDSVQVPGLFVLHDFVSEDEEKVLMAVIHGPQAPWAPSQKTPSKTGSVRRRVQHYGYVFDYETADVLRDRQPANAACPPMPAIPDETVTLLLSDYIDRSVQEGRGWQALAGVVERTRLHEFEGEKRFPDINQMTVNEYRTGEGIGSHIDTPSAFDDGLMSLSLNSGIVMEFRDTKSEQKKLVYLPARSLLLLTGPARYEWEHHIVTRRTDTHNGVVKPRGLRVSLTLRTALELLPEQGAAAAPLQRVESSVFPPLWGGAQHQEPTTVNALQTPETERQHVHAVYDAVATQWHHTRGKRGVLWPGATRFLQELPIGSMVADVGCGDGKYFPAIWEAGSYVIGTDISLPLLQTCNFGTETTENRQVSSHRSQLRNRPAVAVADCMMLPLKDKSVDAAICIAVLHHLSTKERRLRCLQELVRIVQPGGLINVQAWAMEQDEGSRRKFSSTDVFVPFNAQPKYLDKQQGSNTATTETTKSSSSVAELYAQNYDGAEYDERKGLVIFQRYCHLYRQGELEDLATQVEGAQLVECGYETGNHFMILRVLPQ